MNDINVTDVDALVRDIFLAFVRVHVLYHAADGPIYDAASIAHPAPNAGHQATAVCNTQCHSTGVSPRESAQFPTGVKDVGSSSLLVIQVHGSKIATSEERVAHWKILVNQWRNGHSFRD
jgi:hypothetical protein